MSTNPWGSVCNALHTKLLTDPTLVTLLGHTSSAPALGTSYPHKAGPSKFLAIQLFNSRSPLTNARQIKNMRIDLLAFCTKKADAIAIVDRVEYLFDTPDGDNAAYYDFSDSSISVKDARSSIRLPEFFQKDLDRFVEGIRLTVIVNPYNPCN